VKPERRQKNKGYQSLPAKYYVFPGRRRAIMPRRNSEDAISRGWRRLDFDDKSRELG
jgi:hypothetical protein